jgi:5S rRNA maturation endonuclease (ribonuclease M5)
MSEQYSDVSQILEQLGFSIRSDGEFYRSRPIYRDSSNNNSLRVHKRTGRFTDFGADGASGPLSLLVKITLGLKSIEDAETWLGKSSFYIPETPARKAGEALGLVKSYDDSVLDRLLPNFTFYLEKGISRNTLLEFECGMGMRGKMYNRLVFPIFNPTRDKIIGFAGRDLVNDSDTRPKWKLIGKKAPWVYPIHLNRSVLAEKKQVILVESVGDMLALWDYGIKQVLVCFAGLLSKATLTEIIKLNPKDIVIGVNNDEAGFSFSRKIRDKLSKLFDPGVVRVVPPSEEGVIECDFGKMSKSGIEKWAKENNIQ